MISPVSIHNLYKVQNVYHPNAMTAIHSRNSVSFGNRTDDDNSYKIYSFLRMGDYEEALKCLRESSVDFNPNWTSLDTGLPLLAAIYYQGSLLGKANAALGKKYIPEIISRIVIHPQFEPNRTFNVRIPSEDGRRMSYLELALKHNDTNLLLMLGAYGATLDEFSDEELNKLGSYIKSDGYEKFILEAAFTDQPSYIAHNKQLQRRVKRLEKTAKDARAAIDRVNAKLDESDKTGKPLGITDEAAKVARSAQLPKSSKGQSSIKIKGLEEYRVNLANIPASLDELGGMTEAKKAIGNFIIKPWNINTRRLLMQNNIDMPNGFLMYGPPGCGKTYIAKVIAKQLGFPMYEIELGSIGNSYAYTTNNRLKKIFTELEKNYRKTGIPSILFLDEIDSVAAARTLSNSDWKRDEINTLISLLNNSSEKGIIVIGATNLVENVDEAVLRPGRFDKKIEISLPERAERKEIMEKLIAKKPITSGLLSVVDELADLTDGKSCSDISASLNICARNAIYDGTETVTKEDFIKAMKEIDYEANKTKRVMGFAAK